MNYVGTLLLVLLVSLLIIIGAFAINVKLIVPSQDRYTSLEKEKNDLVVEFKKLSTDSSVVYKRINDQINKHECKVLIKYIENTTSNLLSPMIKSVARAIVSASVKHGIPIDIVVGLCEATSGFNPTTFTEYGERGLFKVSPNSYDIINIDDVSKLHEPGVSASAGVSLFAVLLKQNDGDVLSTIKEYNSFNSHVQKTPGIFAAKVFYNSAKYSIFKVTLKFKLKPVVLEPASVDSKTK